MKNLFSHLLSLTTSIALCTSLFSCSSDNNGDTVSNSAINYSSNSDYEQLFLEKDIQDFDSFCDQLFVYSVADSKLNLHYALNDYESYGISSPELVLPKFYGDQFSDAVNQEVNGVLSSLASFDYESLTAEQQYTYDVISAYYNIYAKYDDFDYLTSELRPYSGTFTALPTVLTEFTFNSIRDIELYFNVIEALPDYVDQMLEFEQQIIDNGYGLTNSNLIATKEILSDFVNAQENVAITVFPFNIATVEELTDEQVQDYIDRNEIYIKDIVIPMFNNIITFIDSVYGTAINSQGFYYFEGGKEYYDYNMQYITGVDHMSIDEIFLYLEAKHKENSQIFNELYNQYPEQYADWISGNYTIDVKDAYEWLDFLTEKTTQGDFPPIENLSINIAYMPSSIEQDSVLGYFLYPQIDNYTSSVVKLNNSLIANDPLQAFDTISHETIPGHAYQYAYAASIPTAHPIELVLTNTGYAEAWTVYLTRSNHEFIDDLDPAIWLLNYYNSRDYFYFASLIDIAANYYGWSLEEIYDYTENLYGRDLSIYAKTIYDYILIQPINHTLPYALTPALLTDYETEAILVLGDDFNMTEFRKVFLDCGNVPFSILEQHMNDYIYQ